MQTQVNALARHKQVFESGILVGKFTVLILLLVFAFMNHDASFVAKNPKDFLAEAMAVGGASAVSTLFVGLARHNPVSATVTPTFIAFLVFFLYHVLMEFSGQNSVKKSEKVIKEEKKIFWPVIAIAGAVGLVLAYIALRVRDFDQGIPSSLIQGAIFAIINVIPLMIIAAHRGEEGGKLAIVFFLNFALFAFGFMVLQAGGFWSHVFPLPVGSQKLA